MSSDSNDRDRKDGPDDHDDAPAVGKVRAILGRREVLDALFDGLAIIYASGRVETLNRAAMESLRVGSRDEIPAFHPERSGMTVLDAEGNVLPVRERPVHRAILDDIATRDQLYGMVNVDLEATAGRPVTWFRLSAFPLCEELTGHERAALVTFVDVTEEIEARTAAQHAGERARSTESRFRTLFEKHHAIMLQIDPETGRIVDANEAAARFYGWSRSELRSMCIQDINTLPPEEVRSERLAALSEARNHFIFPHRTAGGQERIVEVHSTPVEIEGTTVLFSIITDVTERQAAERKLRQSAAVFENTSEAVVIADPEGLLVAVNRAFTEITGFSEQDVLGKRLDSLFSERGHTSRCNAITAGLEAVGQWQGEALGRRADGSEYPQWLTASIVRSPEGDVSSIVSVFSDISPLMEVQRRLAFQAHHDDLTRLPNRVLFRERVEQALKAAARGRTALAIFFLDLDRFKVVNDSLGHAVGDQLLVAVAQRLAAAVQPGDLLARIGGDEFIVLVDPSPDRDELVERARQLIGAMEQPFTLEDAEEIFIGVSIGITRFPGDGVSADELIRNADAALYASKDIGRGSFHFYRESLTRQAVERLHIERNMRRALRDNAFSLAWQPIVSSETASIAGVETLLRWKGNDGKFLSPAHFIPIAEDTGFIRALGEWVLRTALTHMREWMDLDIAPPILSVNVSASQLIGAQFPNILRDALETSRVPPGRVELELTEGALFADSTRTLSILRDIAAIGVRIAVDDFGTGYSSLAYLQRFPLHRLKIDRSFISNLPHSPQDCAIARAIIQLGRTLGLEVLAEGVEHDDQLAFLHETGCHLWQGFLCSRALPDPVIQPFLRSCARGEAPLGWTPKKPPEST